MMKMNVYCFIFLAAGISCSSIRSSDVESDEVGVIKNLEFSLPVAWKITNYYSASA